MKPSNDPPTQSNLDHHFDVYIHVHNLFATYLNLNCFFVPVSERTVWKPLFYSRDRGHNPSHYESFFGKNLDRYRFNDQNLNLAERSGKTIVGKHRGFCELFTPVTRDGVCQGFVVAGSFVRQPFTEEELIRNWVGLSGRQPGACDSDFLSYARMALQSVVFSPPVLESAKELLGILSLYLSGQPKPWMNDRLERIRKGAISHGLPHFLWMDFTLGLDKFHPRMGSDGAVQLWETQELGLTRRPTTVLTLTPHAPSSEKWSALRSMVSANRLRWEAMAVAREFPETVAGALEDYGALFVTSATPGKSAVQAKLEIRDRMEAIQSRLERRTGLRLWAGIGRTQAPGDKLAESRQQAVLAMNLCPSRGSKLLFYEDIAEKMAIEPGRGLRQALNRLRKATLSGTPQERDVARSEFIQQAFWYSNEGMESLRAHLLEAYFSLVEALRGGSVQEEGLEVLADAQEERLLAASTVQQMLYLFREGLDRIAEVGDKPLEGARLARMERVKKYVDGHFNRPLRLGQMAEKARLSRPTFLKEFRQATGMGFSEYLQSLRVVEAKRLLRVSPISVARVGQESGFNSASYFTQAFKRATGMSPKAYRDKGGEG